ncbi:NADH-quinone oxidoreductase subunit D [Microlunatus sp. Gsoil 973]|uniref:NADH-quinone oxidoreductase subunit D-related protein n=1 Tax=Microlunatus sp. Gsoil 973 TaxID=2672569 RepID=UPI0012B4CAF7|nr:NADH-quinone oxidoreductase subunit D [Microlunatus sp. Gsoil 973]QGN33856.1 NADH-quinone oxidoreductase subunit D [Microlunatus sp. Gsoil 973]
MPDRNQPPVDQPTRVLIGSPAAGIVPDPPPPGVILLDLGADHPTRAGLLELRIWPDGTRVGRAEVVVGAMHRGAEKLYEVRDYRQILMLADRHDWQAPAAAETVIALACERLLGLEIPVRAQWLRTVLAEHARITSHLGFLGYLWTRNGLQSPVPALRERLRRQLQVLTGNRVHPMINRLGGLAADADDQWLAAEDQLARDALPVADRAVELITELGPEADRIPRLDAQLIKVYGVSGPAARAAGIDLDLRVHQPYLGYPELRRELRVDASEAVPLNGSVRARLWMLAAEIGSSVRVIGRCVERLSELPGPVSVRLGKIVKLPEGEIYAASEAPLGTAGCYLVSRGEKTPWRLKLRTPSFNNVAALEALLPGCPIDDLELLMASCGYVVGDIDK